MSDHQPDERELKADFRQEGDQEHVELTLGRAKVTIDLDWSSDEDAAHDLETIYHSLPAALAAVRQAVEGDDRG